MEKLSQNFHLTELFVIIYIIYLTFSLKITFYMRLSPFLAPLYLHVLNRPTFSLLKFVSMLTYKL